MAEGNNQSYGLVSMTNGDVYYLDRASYKGLVSVVETLVRLPFSQFIDDKNKTLVTIQVAHISSLVLLGGGRG